MRVSTFESLSKYDDPKKNEEQNKVARKLMLQLAAGEYKFEKVKDDCFEEVWESEKDGTHIVARREIVGDKEWSYKTLTVKNEAEEYVLSGAFGRYAWKQIQRLFNRRR